jgi:hypothetical protein
VVTPENIKSAFTQTGIWPFNLSIILDKYEQWPVTPLQDSERGKNYVKTLYLVRRIRQFNKAILKSPSKEMIRKLIKAMLGGRLVRSGVIYWSQCVEGLIVMCMVYIGC